ncbi:hypothetical protein FJN17_12250 [Bradyrhizobium symbiodeficiens]|uniref:DUF2934 domain-containing protein n=1 Tax=Bradyrhizobium symbiodeficiens TaxID=1404367 RepID=A0ABX5W4P9_9BRAD|nr:hypothetical protein [Bradyrhizobium symbiodeficiens]QDF38276.1 hypothetical protein FJN17_12250 [Bradyrhizobium symbiodeficiens]
MGRPPSKLVTTPPKAAQAKPGGKKASIRSDYFTRAELVALEQSWHLGNPDAGREAFYRWYAEHYFGLSPEKIERAEMERVRQLFRDAKVRAREAGWLDDEDKTAG